MCTLAVGERNNEYAVALQQAIGTHAVNRMRSLFECVVFFQLQTNNEHFEVFILCARASSLPRCAQLPSVRNGLDAECIYRARNRAHAINWRVKVVKNKNHIELTDNFWRLPFFISFDVGFLHLSIPHSIRCSFGTLNCRRKNFYCARRFQSYKCHFQTMNNELVDSRGRVKQLREINLEVAKCWKWFWIIILCAFIVATTDYEYN